MPMINPVMFTKIKNSIHLYAATIIAPPIRSFSNSTRENFSNSNSSSFLF